MLHPRLSSRSHDGGREAEAVLEEAVGLARAIDLTVVAAHSFNLSHPTPATLLGSGNVEKWGQVIADESIQLAIIDHTLTPVQQRNLERDWKCKVIDRTGLILEIFGARARTREGQMQVELAALNYQKSRLVRSWTHLERQRGGFGFLGGPGETQIETDRRLIQERIVRIERDLEQVKRTRALHRKSRQEVPYPVAALVGYTNAGKSTLFNALTKAGAYAADQLFATLDTTSRRLYVGGEGAGASVVLSDTVGFIRDLPHALVAAFQATLEETAQADLLLHVVDSASEDRDAQIGAVNQVLAEIGAADVPQILVWNKIDLTRAAAAVERGDCGTIRRIFLSARTGEGLDLLRDALAEVARQTFGDNADRPAGRDDERRQET